MVMCAPRIVSFTDPDAVSGKLAPTRWPRSQFLAVQGCDVGSLTYRLAGSYAANTTPLSNTVRSVGRQVRGTAKAFLPHSRVPAPASWGDLEHQPVNLLIPGRGGSTERIIIKPGYTASSAIRSSGAAIARKVAGIVRAVSAIM